MASKEINIKTPDIFYDDIADVLYISFGKSRPGIAQETTIGDFVRFDKKTGAIVGITIIGFKERYMQKDQSDVIGSATKIIPEILRQFRQ